MKNFDFVFSQVDEKRGYPFFNLSSFSVWIAYKDGNKRTRYSIETNTTISQIIHGRVQELKLDKIQGLQNLFTLIQRQQTYIEHAIIYWRGYVGEDNKKIFEWKNGQWTKHTQRDMNKPMVISIPFSVQDKKIFVKIQTN
jgi:hypothetical protein